MSISRDPPFFVPAADKMWEVGGRGQDPKTRWKGKVLPLLYSTDPPSGQSLAIVKQMASAHPI